MTVAGQKTKLEREKEKERERGNGIRKGLRASTQSQHTCDARILLHVGTLPTRLSASMPYNYFHDQSLSSH